MIVVSVETKHPTLRDEIYGWSMEDSDLYEEPIWKTPHPKRCHQPTVLAYLAHGFRLLGPPTRVEGGGWDWWLVCDQLKREGEGDA